MASAILPRAHSLTPALTLTIPLTLTYASIPPRPPPNFGAAALSSR